MDHALRLQTELLLNQIAFDYDARRLQAEMAVQCGCLKAYRAAFTLLQAVPAWAEGGAWGGDAFKRRQLVLEWRTEAQMRSLLPVYRTLAKVAASWEVPRIVLTWAGASAEESYQVASSMGEGDDIFDIPPPLNLDVSIAETMRLGEVIRQSEHPMGLIVNASDWQVWANAPLSVMCGKPIAELIRMNVRGNWVDRRARTDDGLASVKHRLATSPQGFELHYTTKVSPEATAKTNFHSRFEMVLNNHCRLTTIYNYQPANAS